METFSTRHGYQPGEPEITIRQGAPDELRGVVVDIGYEAGLTPHRTRTIVCRVLRVREDQYNWSAYPNVDGEVRGHLDTCEWYEVYDVVEACYHELLSVKQSGQQPEARPEIFADELNKYFRKRGIGWELFEGALRVRGTDIFQQVVSSGPRALEQTGRTTAAGEVREAIHDLSRRPQPDLTGAIQHALAALECVMRDVCADPKATLGALLSRHKGLIPPPLDQAVDKMWGFASEHGRHLREGREPSYEDAALAVHVATALALYLNRKTST